MFFVAFLQKWYYHNRITYKSKTFFVSVIPRTVLLSNLCFFRSGNESMFLWVKPKLYYFKNRVLSCRDTKIELPRSYYLWINRGCCVLCGFITIAVVVIPKRYYLKKKHNFLCCFYTKIVLPLSHYVKKINVSVSNSKTVLLLKACSLLL